MSAEKVAAYRQFLASHPRQSCGCPLVYDIAVDALLVVDELMAKLRPPVPVCRCDDALIRNVMTCPVHGEDAK